MSQEQSAGQHSTVADAIAERLRHHVENNEERERRLVRRQKEAQARQQEEAKWRDHLAALAPQAAVYLQKLGASPEEARDAVQTAVAEAWERRSGIDDFRAYIWRTARNTYFASPVSPTALHEDVLPVPQYHLPAHVVEARDEAQRVLTAMRQLPFRQREALALTGDGFKAAEIAKMTGTTLPAVRQSISRARAALKVLLTVEEGDR